VGQAEGNTAAEKHAFIVHEVSDAEAQDDCAQCIAECEECTTLQKKIAGVHWAVRMGKPDAV
jgi:hypothetical protein